MSLKHLNNNPEETIPEKIKKKVRLTNKEKKILRRNNTKDIINITITVINTSIMNIMDITIRKSTIRENPENRKLLKLNK